MRLFVRAQKGQSIVEYLVLVAAVAAVLIVAVAKGSPFAGAVQGLIASPMNMIIARNQEIQLVVDNSLAPTASKCITVFGIPICH